MIELSITGNKTPPPAHTCNRTLRIELSVTSGSSTCLPRGMDLDRNFGGLSSQPTAIHYRVGGFV